MFAQGYGKGIGGILKNRKEVSFLADDDLGLYIIRDGNGGEQCSVMASSIAVRAASEYVRERFDQLAEAGFSGASEDLALKIAEESLLQDAREKSGDGARRQHAPIPLPQRKRA